LIRDEKIECQGAESLNFIHEPNRVYALGEGGNILASVTFPDLSGGTVTIDRVYVDESLRGGGVAAALMEQAYENIKNSGRRASAACPYAVRWFEKNPGMSDILL
jgi:predicted GNAT family acetyltransferase